LSDKDLLGILYIESIKPNDFGVDDIQTLETLANQVSASLQRARLYSSTQEHLRIMTAVQSISDVISNSLELEVISEAVVKVLKHSFGYTHVSIYLLREDYLYLGAQLGYSEELIIPKIYMGQGVSGKTIETKKAQFIKDVNKDPNFLRAANDITSEICIPLLKENTVLGTLNVEGNASAPLTQADVDMLITLAGPIALAVDNARLHEQVKTIAMTDAVSGLSNRHALEKALQAEMQRAMRIDAPLSLIIFDIDSFKDYNDKWGHPAGDDRLKATADLIRNNLRNYDIAARYGGDEFAIILPNTNKAGALLFANRLLTAAQINTPKTPITEQSKAVSGYTLSIGLATFPQDADSLTTLLLAADQAELMAKRLGKNQIIVAGEPK
jgi:diguanylate cyclase (GGDEF)-like protein